MAIKPEDLGKEIAKQLKTYTTEIEETLEEVKESSATKAVTVLKATSPRRKGKYAKGWRKKKDGKDFIIHNATHYQLTHLLEKGHAKRGGGRVAGRPHIQPVEEMVIKEFEQTVEKVIRG